MPLPQQPGQRGLNRCEHELVANIYKRSEQGSNKHICDSEVSSLQSVETILEKVQHGRHLIGQSFRCRTAKVLQSHQSSSTQVQNFAHKQYCHSKPATYAKSKQTAYRFRCKAVPAWLVSQRGVGCFFLPCWVP